MTTSDSNGNLHAHDGRFAEKHHSEDSAVRLDAPRPLNSRRNPVLAHARTLRDDIDALRALRYDVAPDYRHDPDIDDVAKQATQQELDHADRVLGRLIRTHQSYPFA
ncbi:hypothetical protein [Curtobacterium sp. MCBD17_040]|uniref:hypothetical protein n=1 Tax=Curtobacterium sp. MCBD17_040 TaxID=2175674 RepID=UPI000DA942BC|nr:hypothetical protein [Curtobacterium sp. MCBD17_040]WIB65494.1 hypothetical protein DEI94_19160 [Curtobacterium sp. MCBD17_040]